MDLRGVSVGFSVGTSILPSDQKKHNRQWEWVETRVVTLNCLQLRKDAKLGGVSINPKQGGLDQCWLAHSFAEVDVDRIDSSD